MITLIIIQTIADEQQHRYQSKKYKLINSKQKLIGNFKKKDLLIRDYGNTLDIQIILVNN